MHHDDSRKLVRVTSLKMLGVTISSKLSVGEQVGGVISPCAQSVSHYNAIGVLPATACACVANCLPGSDHEQTNILGGITSPWGQTPWVDPLKWRRWP